MRSEREFGSEHGLSLEPGSLTDVKMVVIALKRLSVHVEYFGAQMQGHASVGPLDESSVALFNRFPFFVENLSPSYRILHF